MHRFRIGCKTRANQLIRRFHDLLAWRFSAQNCGLIF
jgi:hypothetical protein